jgi:hypothetical protein
MPEKKTMATRGRFGPKALLDLMQEIDELAGRVRDASAEPAARRRAAAKRAAALRRLRAALGRGRDPFRAALSGLAAASRVPRSDLVFVVALFNRRLRSPQPTTPGRELIELVVAPKGDVAGKARSIHPDAPLLRSGFLETDAFAPEHVFDAGFRLNDDVFKLLYRAYHGLLFDPSAAEPPRPAPYTAASDHLLANRALVELAKRRAARLFPQSGWAEAFADESRAPEEIQRLFDVQTELVRAREDVTPESVRLPLFALRREFGLSPDEELIVCALLLQELYSNRSALELGELLRLVARDEADLLARRGVVGPAGKLREAGLVVVDGESDGKDLASSAWLPPWLADRLLGADAPARAINAEERSRFRAYLDQLQSSDDFYRRL